MTSSYRLLLATLFLSVLVPLGASSCNDDGPPPDDGCSADADCADGRHCANNGDCVACISADHCAAGELCCAGECLEDGEQESSCGCDAEPNGSSGSSCDPLELCVSGGERVDATSLAAGSCECTCDPAQGGTLCTVDQQAALGFSCSCDRTDLATCERPALDGVGTPHVVADTCNPSEACVCFGEAQPCDPNGGNPDCTINGCENLFGNNTSCGVPDQDCTAAASGLDDTTGTCINGGCECDGPSDCQGGALNVDQCSFVSAGLQCVCDAYTLSGEEAACPLGLECVADGCQYGGTAYDSATALYGALNIDAPPVSSPGPVDAGPVDSGPSGDGGA